VEKVFLSGDTIQLKTIMTESALDMYKGEFTGLCQVMTKMGEALKTRKII